MTPEEFWDILHSMPEPQPVFYRLYYNGAGEPVCYSMEHLPGNYIDIDAETFGLAPHNVCVVNNKLKYITTRTSDKLVPGNTGTQCLCCRAQVCQMCPATQAHSATRKMLRS